MADATKPDGLARGDGVRKLGCDLHGACRHIGFNPKDRQRASEMLALQEALDMLLRVQA